MVASGASLQWSFRYEFRPFRPTLGVERDGAGDSFGLSQGVLLEAHGAERSEEVRRKDFAQKQVGCQCSRSKHPTYLYTHICIYVYCIYICIYIYIILLYIYICNVHICMILDVKECKDHGRSPVSLCLASRCRLQWDFPSLEDGVYPAA